VIHLFARAALFTPLIVPVIVVVAIIKFVNMF
jgi:hypothetical protein